MLERESLGLLFPQAPGGHLDAIAARAGELLAGHGIAGLRLEHFLAQVGHETAGLTVLEENLSYSAERLCAVWPARFPTPEAAAPFARSPRRLADRVYGDRMGNRSEASGDGWAFRGRGYLQITGRATYRAAGRSAGLDLEAAPELALEPGHALAVACGYWSWRGLDVFADRDDLVALTRRLNGGSHGLDDRRAWLERVRAVLGGGGPVLPPAAVAALQRALKEAGYAECGAADGIIGLRTLGAVARLRRERGQPGAGIDAVLLETLGLGP
jgi:putative chitinase